MAGRIVFDGRPLPGFEPAIVDATGNRAANGEIGEICVRPGHPGQFLGYWNQPDKTSEKVRGGWIHTGDLGRTDATGKFWYEGRIDDVICTAGYRVGPGEIEECLLAHLSVALSAAVGIPDELLGEAIHAFGVLADGHTQSDELAAELQRHVRRQSPSAPSYP
jgi:acetyl-CoA synthetase